MIIKIYAAATLIMGIITFAVFGIDKFKAKNNLWRIPEDVLILLSLCGGSVGAILGMKYFHHKTKKLKFIVAVPVTLVLWALLGLQLGKI